MKYVFHEGDIQSPEPYWEIVTNMHTDYKCKHSKGILCPRVVIAYGYFGNMGHYLCLDCILEAEKTLTETKGE